MKKKLYKTKSYRLKFIDSTRFMASLLSNLINNLAEEIHKIKCKNEHGNKQCKRCEIKYKDCDCFLEYKNFKNDLIEYKCLCCSKSYEKYFTENLKKQFFNIYKVSNHGS